MGCRLMIGLVDERIIADFIDTEDWAGLAETVSLQDIVQHLSFKDCLRLAQKFLYEESPRNVEIAERGLELIRLTKETHFAEWRSSWRYEAFFAEAHELLWRYDEKFAAYKLALEMALEQTGKAPPGLLVRLASCAFGPPDPPASLDQALEWLRLAVKDHPYVDAVRLISAYYYRRRDKENEAHWERLLKRIEATGEDTPPIIPAFLEDEPDAFECLKLLRPRYGSDEETDSPHD
jgi:tetratricopeptide (TPR) repeat protein